jgi:hypothetical protein
MDLTPKQQTSEAVRQAETILLTSGQHPSIDQVAAVVGLAAILRKFGKKVSAVISDTVPQSVQMIDGGSLDRNIGGLRDFVLKLDVSKAEVDKLRYEVIDGKLNIFVTPFKGNFAPSDVTFDYGESHFDYDLAIVLGVPTRARIDRVYDQNLAMFEQIPVINLDFHRSNENYGAVNLIEPNASSLCEMLVALAESLQGGIIDADIATALLMGIVASTDRFTAAHTTPKSLTVAAQMMAAGARQQAVVRSLYRDGKGGQPAPERTQGAERTSSSRDNNRNAPSHQVAEPRPERRTEAEPQRQQPAVMPQRPERPVVAQNAPEDRNTGRRDGELPIIQPGHIEMSLPDDDQPAARPVDRPAPSVQPVQDERRPEAEPPAPLPPMADFAAAAEILGKRPAENPSQTETTE